eukprot:522328-Amorphochlora_amoeboformis.AAC.1
MFKCLNHFIVRRSLSFFLSTFLLVSVRDVLEARDFPRGVFLSFDSLILSPEIVFRRPSSAWVRLRGVLCKLGVSTNAFGVLYADMGVSGMSWARSTENKGRRFVYGVLGEEVVGTRGGRCEDPGGLGGFAG